MPALGHSRKADLSGDFLGAFDKNETNRVRGKRVGRRDAYTQASWCNVVLVFQLQGDGRGPLELRFLVHLNQDLIWQRRQIIGQRVQQLFTGGCEFVVVGEEDGTWESD